MYFIHGAFALMVTGVNSCWWNGNNAPQLDLEDSIDSAIAIEALLEGPDAEAKESINSVEIFGDLIYTKDQYEYFYGNSSSNATEDAESGSTEVNSRSFINPRKIWNQYYSNGRYQIAYRINRETYDSRSYGMLLGLLRIIEADFLENTGIELGNQDQNKFRNHRHWIEFQGNRGGCWSWLGRIVDTGAQVISLQNPGCLFRSTIIHEIMHAMGWQHEQNRADRDNYVEILWENIRPEARRQFYRWRGNPFGTRYEVESLMHYPSDAFATEEARKKGLDTIRPRNGTNRIPKTTEFWSTGWLNRGLTVSDAFEINNAYSLKKICDRINGTWYFWDSVKKQIVWDTPRGKTPRNTCGKADDECKGITTANPYGFLTALAYKKGLISKSSSLKIVSYWFWNQLSYYVDLFWIDRSGKARFVTRLGPRWFRRINMYFGDTWLIKRAGNYRGEPVAVWQSRPIARGSYWYRHLVKINREAVNYFQDNAC